MKPCTTQSLDKVDQAEPHLKIHQSANLIEYFEEGYRYKKSLLG